MALDVGTLRIGVALSDPLRITGGPLSTIVRTDPEEDARRILALAAEHGVGRLIVGLPRHLDGSPGDTLGDARRLAELVAARSRLKVAWCDERLSSKEAEELMSAAKLPVAARRARRDEFAAAVILRRYLDGERS